jgi:hypothetical protein
MADKDAERLICELVDIVRVTPGLSIKERQVLSRAEPRVLEIERKLEQAHVIRN